jgi:glycosyltransferase involved in cell wall biosynthesis
MMPASEARAALIVPALDEEGIIGPTLDSIPRGLFRLVIVADNGSQDSTASIARKHGAVVVSEPERGYGAACLRAIDALPVDIDVVVFMQADGSEDPREAAQLVAPILEGRADLVIGSRLLGRAEKGALLAHQRFGNWLATTLIRWRYGFCYTDLGPFRAISTSALRRLGLRDRNYGWTVEMQVRALQAGLRVIETPVSYKVRQAGTNKVSGSAKASVEAGVKILWTVARLALSK